MTVGILQLKRPLRHRYPLGPLPISSLLALLSTRWLVSIVEIPQRHCSFIPDFVTYCEVGYSVMKLSKGNAIAVYNLFTRS